MHLLDNALGRLVDYASEVDHFRLKGQVREADLSKQRQLVLLHVIAVGDGEIRLDTRRRLVALWISCERNCHSCAFTRRKRDLLRSWKAKMNDSQQKARRAPDNENGDGHFM